METTTPECFVIMPISDPEGYEPGHFRRVYDTIISPACKAAGYKPVRADDVVQTTCIHLNILKRLIESPMAVCDLSTRNPNVLFELGIRQAFNRPVVLIQERGTPRIFDIDLFRYHEYRREWLYDQVIEDQKNIVKAIDATRAAVEKGDAVNSLVRLLALTPSDPLKRLVSDLIKANRDLGRSVAFEVLDCFEQTIGEASVCPKVAGRWSGMVNRKDQIIEIKQKGPIVFLEGTVMDDDTVTYTFTGEGRIVSNVLVFKWITCESGDVPTHGVNVMKLSPQGDVIDGKYFNSLGGSGQERYEIVKDGMV